MPPLLITRGDRGPGLKAVVYYHVTSLFVYNFSHVVIMSVHDTMLIADFWWCLRAVNDFCVCVAFWFSLFMPAAMLDHADRPHLSKLFARLC